MAKYIQWRGIASALSTWRRSNGCGIQTVSIIVVVVMVRQCILFNADWLHLWLNRVYISARIHIGSSRCWSNHTTRNTYFQYIYMTGIHYYLYDWRTITGIHHDHNDPTGGWRYVTHQTYEKPPGYWFTTLVALPKATRVVIQYPGGFSRLCWLMCVVSYCDIDNTHRLVCYWSKNGAGWKYRAGNYTTGRCSVPRFQQSCATYKHIMCDACPNSRTPHTDSIT